MKRWFWWVSPATLFAGGCAVVGLGGCVWIALGAHWPGTP